MADSNIQLNTDGTGKKIDTRTESTNNEHRQVFVVGDPTTNAGVAPVDGTKGLAVDLTNTGQNGTKLLVTPDLPSGASTAAKQPALGTAGTASSDVITVQGIASMTKLLVTPDLPTGAATSTKQSDGTQKTQIVDGSGNVVGTTSNALDINIKSGNPTSITANNPADTTPATQTITAADSATTSTSQQNSQSAITGTPTASSAATFSISALDSISVQVTGTWVATIVSEVSYDGGTTYFSRGFHLNGTNYQVGSITANATGTMNTAGVTNIRLRATAYTSGTATVKVVGSVNPNTFYLANSPQIADGTTPSQKLAINASGQISESNLPTTVDTNSGSKSASTLRVVLATDQPQLTNKLLVTPDSVALPAHQSTNVDQWNGTTTDTNSGNKSAGTLRVVLATDQPALTNALTTTQTPATSGGLSVFNASSGKGATALTNSAQAVKASAGQLYGWRIYNPNTVAAYVQLFNATTGNVTLGTTTNFDTITVPPLSSIVEHDSDGIAYGTAISAAATTTGTGSTAPSTALDAVFYYK